MSRNDTAGGGMQHPDDPSTAASSTDRLDDVLAAAFAPGMEAPVASQVIDRRNSVIRSLGRTLPHPVASVHLREPTEEALAPVLRPRAAGATAAADLLDAAGRYQIAGEIARGGMGAILRGRDTDLGRDLAFKVLLEAHTKKPELVQRFVEEAQITGQLQHPGVAPVYELGQLADQRPYFTMKLVKGRTLSALLSGRKSPADDRARFIGIFSQIAQTLAYAHARGVIHRDLKPSNVMVGAFGEVQVMDWGLAKVLGEGGVADERKAERNVRERQGDVSVIRTARSGGSSRFGSGGSATQVGSVLGTPAYMAPEQAQGDVDRLDERADVFGLGAILCEILTGSPPYDGDDATAVYHCALRGDLEEAFARIAACEADAELAALASRCLAADRKDRPADAGVVAAEITAYLRSVESRLKAAELESVAASTRAAEEKKRRRVTVALSAAVLLAAGAGGATWLHFHAERAAQVAQRTREVQAELTRARELHQAARNAGAGDLSPWIEARKRLEIARVLVDGALVDAAVAAQVAREQAAFDEEEKDARLLAALEKAGTAEVDVDSAVDPTASGRMLPLYREALAAYGLPPGRDPPAAAAAHIRERAAPVRDAIIAGLDTWIRYAPGTDSKEPEPHLEWLKTVVREADRDSPWRVKVRTAAAEKDLAALEQLVAEADVRGQHPLGLVAVAAWLADLDGRPAAVDLLRRAQAEHAGDFFLNYALSIQLWNLDREKHSAEAVRYASAAVALKPGSARARRSLATCLFFSGELERGVLQARKAVELEPGWALAWSNLGYGLSQQGNLEESLAAGRRAVDLNPGSSAYWSNLAEILKRLGRHDEAIDAFRRCLALDPTQTSARQEVVFDLAGKGQHDEALALAKAGLEAKPDSVTLRTLYGAALEESGRVEEAKAEYRRALAMNPNRAWPHCRLGHLLSHEGKHEGATAEHRRAAELEPGSSHHKNSLASSLVLEGKLDEALGAAREAVALDPRDAGAADTLGQIHLRRDELDEALRQFRAALRIDPGIAESLAGLVDVLARQGQWAAAVLECAGHLERAPESKADILPTLQRLAAATPQPPELAAAFSSLVAALDRIAASGKKHRPDLLELRAAVAGER